MGEQAKSMKKLDFNIITISQLPDDTLISLVKEKQSDVLEMIDYCYSINSSTDHKLQMFKLLRKLVIILPPDDKRPFISAGTFIWFSKVIHNMMTLLSQDQLNTEILEVMEILADEISNNDDICAPMCFLENIRNRSKYPKTILTLLENHSLFWHRIWIVFIKLLKEKVTTVVNDKGTPLNSMLPVVETAFKMDADTRCRAFLCWNALIENFSKEINDTSISRRIKLLMVPLKINNAKAKEPAETKFNTWWKLIRKFESKLENYKDVVVLFLQFCFGRPNLTGSTFVIPGKLTDDLKIRSVEAFVELTGHVDCNGCTTIPKLNTKILCTSFLVKFWSDWIHSLHSAIMTVAIENKENSQQHGKCMWKSFLLTIGDMPENSLRSDLIMELLKELDILVKESVKSIVVADFVFNSMILSLFDNEQNIKQVFKPIGTENDPLKKMICLMVDESFTQYFNSITPKEVVRRLQPVTNVLLVESSHSPNHVIQWALKELPVNDNTLLFWIALANSTNEFNTDICILELCNMLLWPLIHMHKFTDLHLPALTWYTLCINMYKKIRKTEINEQIANIILSSDRKSCLLLCACLTIVKHNIEENGTSCEKQVNLLQQLTTDLNDYQENKEIFAILVDTLVILLNYLTTSVNEDLAQSVLGSTKNLFLGSGVRNQPHVITENLLKAVSELLNIDSYSKYMSIIENELRTFLTENLGSESVNRLINSIVSKPSTKTNKGHIAITERIIEERSASPASSKTNDIITKNKFTKPITPKRGTKKEASILNTVVENGEEYVVVKSNWKFNPKNLTENQKEKLKRKREDIPALYQDLSQSQDEFKSMLWKNDSEDTSASNKSDKEEVSSVLKELLSSDVVPKIRETMVVDNVNSNSKEHIKELPKTMAKNKLLSTPRSVKSPRMALKDRLFRNVKMLTEKSAIGSNKTITEAQIHCDNEENTPQSKQRNNQNLVNSAPPLLLTERPSRVKRMPKKFDDTEIFAISKKNNKPERDISLNKSENENENELSEVALGPDDLHIENISLQVITKDNTKLIRKNENMNIDSDKEICEKSKQNVSESSKTVDVETAEKECIKETPTRILVVELENINKKTCDTIQEPEVNNKIDSQKSNKTLTSSSSTNELLNEKITLREDSNVIDINTTPNINLTNKEQTEIAEMSGKDKSNKNESNELKSAIKKKSKISRIEKELAIDMVEGHPLLKADKRSTRHNLASANIGRRTSLADKLKKAKSDKNSTKTPKKPKLTEISDNPNSSENIPTLEDTCELSQNEVNSEDLSCSEDIIESSQDSTFTTISITKKTPVKKLYVKVNKLKNLEENVQLSQEILQDSECQIISDDLENIHTQKKVCHKIAKDVAMSAKLEKNQTEDSNKVLCETENSFEHSHCEANVLPNRSANQDSKDDTDIPENKTAFNDNDMTENMDTEPFEDNTISNDVMVVDSENPPIIISSEEMNIGSETQEIAEADTQPAVSQDILEMKSDDLENSIEHKGKDKDADKVNTQQINDELSVNCTEDEFTRSITESFNKNVADTNDVSSPFKDDLQRKQDFLNNTSEISPIKIVSPERDKKSPSPETSSDYVVIKLSTPVQSNGEPFEKNESPEIFTEDKESSDVRDQSPPRTEMGLVANNSSPSSSLSLKKNRPQVRPGGRAAQMLGLCVPDKLNSIINTERNDADESKRNSPSNTQARRNLRHLYNIGLEGEEVNENENENFLSFKRKLPPVNSSPAGPILKRKLTDIEDETTVSPAGKRKRVSFHDPPVSTTVAVQKYIEPFGVRSPQNSAQKRIERQLRNYTNMKSPKRLDNVFKLDSVLNKAVESFTDVDLVATDSDDTQNISLETTPAIEIVRASDLNDKDPICPLLVECKDPIDVIAGKLSPTTTKSWLVKELQGKIETVGDLAKMTELDVNRLCIKAPKVKTAKKILNEYTTVYLEMTDKISEKDANNFNEIENIPTLNNKVPIVVNNEKADCVDNLFIEDNVDLRTDDTIMVEEMAKCNTEMLDAEVQTCGTIIKETDMQTDGVTIVENSVQTDTASTLHVSVQTNETGEKTTADIVSFCLNKRNDFVDQLTEQLDESSIELLTQRVPLETINEWAIKRITSTDQSEESREEYLLDHIKSIISRFMSTHEPRNVILFYSKLLQKLYDKPA